VTADVPPGAFDSGTLFTDGTFTFTFTTVNDYHYICQIHFGMEGDVDVRLGGDATGDNSVNINDFAALAANFNLGGQTYDTGDFNLSGTVDIQDFAILAANFNTSATLSAQQRGAVPEPSLSASAAAMVTSFGLRRSRRLRRLARES
jgi:hypothetical protein